MDELDNPRTIRVEEVAQVTPETVQTLIEIDLQTFAEYVFAVHGLGGAAQRSGVCVARG